jgi:hypothetical protein
MQISHKYKFIFFSNPKTGSESVRKILEPYSEEKVTAFRKRTSASLLYSHITPHEVQQIFREKGINYDDYFKFVFVRNPWARLVSLYEMIYATNASKNVKSPLRFKLKMFHKKVFTRKPDFNFWLKSVQNDGIGAGGKEADRWRRYGSYSIDNYIMDNEKNILVDKVIKLEDIDKELIPTLVNLNLPNANNIKIENINNRNYQKYAKYYNQESIERVSCLYKYDIENFNYQFGE